MEEGPKKVVSLDEARLKKAAKEAEKAGATDASIFAHDYSVAKEAPVFDEEKLLVHARTILASFGSDEEILAASESHYERPSFEEEATQTPRERAEASLTSSRSLFSREPKESLLAILARDEQNPNYYSPTIRVAVSEALVARFGTSEKR